MRAISLFSGAGGMDAGFVQAGIHSVLACELDRTAAATYRRNFSGQLHNGDIRDLLPELRKDMADIVFGGPPCQGYSVAGKMNPHDPRSALVHTFMDVVAKVSPSVFVMENVDALARLEKWRGTLQDIRGRATSSGYATHVEILDAADYGVPQARKRMFMWGSRDLGENVLSDLVSRSLAPMCTSRGSARTVFDQLGPAGTTLNPLTSKAIVTFCKKPVLRASPYAGMLFNGAGRPIDPDKPAPTISASAGGNKTHIVDEAHVFWSQPPFVGEYRGSLSSDAPRQGLAPNHLRRLTLAESRNFQTFPESFVFEGSISSQYRQIGNAVPTRLAYVVACAALEAAGAAVSMLAA